MRVTRKHLSVVNGRARFAQVTVADDAPGRASVECPVLKLNDREMQPRSVEDERFIEAAVIAARETEKRPEWHGSPLVVTTVESSYVDMHPDAAREAAISAATALIEAEQ